MEWHELPKYNGIQVSQLIYHRQQTAPASGKTESILFGSRPRFRSKSVYNISCKGTANEGKKSVKYLWLNLGAKPFWSNDGQFYYSKGECKVKVFISESGIFKF